MDRSDRVERVLMYGAELRSLFAGPFTGPGGLSWEKRANELLADFQSFVRGDHVSLCFRPRQHIDSTFGRLEPIEDSIWDFRSRKDRPSLRILGGFAAPNIFVAFNWWPRFRKLAWSDREPLINDERWAAAIADADRKWMEIIGKKRVSGDKVRKYVTRNFSLS
jgi:hypothetical protein